MTIEIVDAPTGLPLLSKQPSELRRYYMDFSAKLRGNTLAAVVSLSIAGLGRVTGAAALTPSAASIVGDSVTFTLAGGSNGEVYKITAIVTDSGGNTLECDGALMVTDF